MRELFVLLLCCWAVTARADGFAFGKSFAALQETDQTAVIRLEPDAVTVDMYIAIDGIPKGETITFVLPFWHKPEGFAMREEAGETFRQRVVAPANAELEWNNALASGRAAASTLLALSDVGTVLTGPLCSSLAFPMFGKGREGGAPLNPYLTAATPNARAELYEGGWENLQALLATAGLPKEHVAALRKYRTSYYAVVRITGTGATVAGAISSGGRGVLYHFRHRMAGERTYTYTYPLGTGAAWPKPIVLTQVYATCPDSCYLEIKAPTEGHWIRYWPYARRLALDAVRDPKRYREDAARLAGVSSEDPRVPPMTGSFLYGELRRPSAWHRMYMYANPKEDIVIRLKARPLAWRMKLARAVEMPWVPYALASVVLVLSWALAIRWVLRPRWEQAGRPGSLTLDGLRYVATISLVVWLISGVPLLLFISALALGSVWPIAVFVALVAGIIIWRVRSGKKALLPFLQPFVLDVGVPLWFVALCLYVTLSFVMCLLVALLERSAAA